MGNIWNGTWLTVAFLSELAALGALAAWGWTAGGSTATRIVLAVGIPAVAALLWGVFAAPHAVVQLLVAAVLVKVVFFGSAAGALLALGRPALAVGLAAAALLGSLLPTLPGSSTPDAARPVVSAPMSS